MNSNQVSEESVLEYLKNLTILCIDDSQTTTMLYDIILKHIVKEVVFAVDGKHGYEVFQEKHVDIIITDYHMPNVNGLELTKKIREESNDIPIILVSEIEDTDVIIQALQMRITNFIRKPITEHKVLELLSQTAKILMANEYIEEQKNKKIKALQEKERYNSYQEDLAFAKELNILRNDFYYQLIDSDKLHMIDFLYNPLDIVSGDAYSARCIDDTTTFYLMVDGMGKGLSASLTAMIITSFVNHTVDEMIQKHEFNLKLLIQKSIEYLKPILIDEESLSIDFIVIDNNRNKLFYSKFSMPALLMEDYNKNIIKLKSNNPPLSKWQQCFKINSYDITNIKKFLIYTDGIVENITIYDEQEYVNFIDEDFKNSFTREELKEKFNKKIKYQEDDITLIYIHKLNPHNDTLIEKRVYNSTLEEVDHANEWYNTTIHLLTQNDKYASMANLVFTELFLNAHEHGNLGIDSKTKHKLLEDDLYFDVLLEKEAQIDKKIYVELHHIENNNQKYLITKITDEGAGFDTQILSEIFRNSQRFNGRGVFVSRKNSLGIYYNRKGNSVLYLNKL